MKNLKSLFILSATVFSLLFVAHHAGAADTVPFAIGEWEPYTGEKIPNHGMATEIVNAACKAAGLTAEFDFSPWKRAENSVHEGSRFGTFPYKELPDRKDTYLFTKPLFSSSFAILVNTRNSKTTGFSYKANGDFTGYQVGIVAGTDAIKLPLVEAGVKVDEVPTSEQNIKKLKANRIDFYIDDRAVIFQTLEQNFSAEERADFAFLDSSFGAKNDFCIMASKSYPDSQALVDKINDGLKAIADSGQLSEILGRYGL